MLVDPSTVPAAADHQPLQAPDWADSLSIDRTADLWVFAYGSLMWNPGFPFLERHVGVLGGYHRRFCVLSYRYRGTPDRPGLVLGLDHGGSCPGILYRVPAPDVPATLDYLWDREMNTYAYRAKVLRVRLRGGATAEGASAVDACCFIVNRNHDQYCGCLDEATLVERIAACCGQRGSNIDYLANTVAHLDELGLHDRRLTRLHRAVRSHLETQHP